VTEPWTGPVTRMARSVFPPTADRPRQHARRGNVERRFAVDDHDRSRTVGGTGAGVGDGVGDGVGPGVGDGKDRRRVAVGVFDGVGVAVGVAVGVGVGVPAVP